MTVPTYAIRPVTWADEPFLYDLHRATMSAYVAQTWGTWDERVQRSRFRAKFQPETHQILVVDGQDVGVVCVYHQPDALFLAIIEIAPEQQGNGLGTAIVNDVLEEAGHAGLPVTLQVLKVNPAQRLYQRLGFVVVHETSTHVHMRCVANQSP